MTSSFLLVVIVSSSWLGSASAECTGGNSGLVVPASGPTVCLSLDDYIQLQKDASSDGESVSYYRRLIRLKEVYKSMHVQTDAPPPTSAVSASTPSQVNIHIRFTLTLFSYDRHTTERFEFGATILSLHVSSLATNSRQFYGDTIFGVRTNHRIR